MGHSQQPGGSEEVSKHRISARRHSRSCPPYNPGLKELVEGKQAWSHPIDRSAVEAGFRGWHQRGYLPHRDAPGLTQFVTCRLHDSFPVSRRAEWEALLQMEDNRQRRTKLEEYLDTGHGSCWLGQENVAAVAERVLREFDGKQFSLHAWVVMPNHIHVLVQILAVPLTTLTKLWKGRIAIEANKLLHRQGAFWQRDYWDTFMRSDEQTIKARRYIEQNPVKAKLVRDPRDWKWSSAQYRDAYGRLVIPPAELNADV